MLYNKFKSAIYCNKCAIKCFLIKLFVVSIRELIEPATKNFKLILLASGCV